MLGEPWGLLGLLALPAILAIHLYRRRRRPVPVSALFLWAGAPARAHAGRQRQRLRRSASLLCELGAALAATWYLSDPHPRGAEEARHVVLILDTRARLQAGAVHTRLREAATRQLRALHRLDRVTLVLSGDPPALAASEVSPAEALAALDGWHPAAPWHELERSLQLASGLDASARWLLTDAPPAALPAAVGLVARGEALPNVGLVDARWEIDATGAEWVAGRAAAYGGAARAVTLSLQREDGALVESARLRLQPGESAEARFAAPTAAARLRLALAPGDGGALAFDDAVTLLRPPRRPVRVALDLPAAEAALVQRALGVLRDVPAADAAAADLVFAAGAAPPDADAPERWWVRLAPGDGAPVLGPFLARRGHPLLRQVDLTGALWSGPASAPTPGHTVLAQAGPALLIEEARAGRARRIRLHLDLTRSTLPHHPGWPALVANLVEARREALPGAPQPNLMVGRASTLVLPAEHAEVVLREPGGETRTLRAGTDGRVLLPPLRASGEHTLHFGAEDGPWQLLAALPLDARLSDLSAGAHADRAATEAAPARVERRRGALAHFAPLLLAALLALGAWGAWRRELRPAQAEEAAA